MQEIKKYLSDFLYQHKVSVTDIVIQCDSDCDYFAKEGGLKHTRKGAAYKLSDYIAWCNNKDKTPITVKEVDFTADIPIKMKKILGI